jgi:hypothetical protein
MGFVKGFVIQIPFDLKGVENICISLNYMGFHKKADKKNIGI